MRTGLFGGTFDPVHNGHLACARYVKDEFNLDRVIFIPSKNPVHKNAASASAEDRVKMLLMATTGIVGFEISRIEVDRVAPSFSVLTVKDMASANPHDSFFFVLGVDIFNTLSIWREPETLMSMVSFIVMGRDGVRMDESIVKKSGAVFESKFPRFDISSTEIRAMIRSGESVEKLVDPAVERYITEKRLYLL